MTVKVDILADESGGFMVVGLETQDQISWYDNSVREIIFSESARIDTLSIQLYLKGDFPNTEATICSK